MHAFQRISLLVFSTLLLFATANAQYLWQKDPLNPVLKNYMDANNNYADVYSPTVMWDATDGLYKMWFAAEKWSSPWSICYATSADGRHWSPYQGNPVLELGPSGTFDSQWIRVLSVIYASGKYMMYYTGFDGSSQRIGLAISDDGIHWTKDSTNPVLNIPGVGEPKVIRVGTTFLMLYGYIKDLYIASSEDGVHWSPVSSEPVLTTDNVIPGPYLTPEGFTVTDNVFYILFGSGPGTPIRLATSNDALHWTKSAGPVILSGETSSWESKIEFGSMIFKDGVFEYWYGGYSGSVGRWQIGHATSPKSIEPPSSDILGLWHLDEPSGNIAHDSSPNHNDGNVYGTAIVPGVFSNGRYFYGYPDCIQVNDPTNGSLDMPASQSFTISAWFKTTGTGYHIILRKGLAPVPGYQLDICYGRLHCIIGNREDGTPPDTLLWTQSDKTYNDGQWHHALLIRDRERKTISLYCDDKLAGPSITDEFPYDLANDRPLNIGRWEMESMTNSFVGVLDEIAIYRGARYPTESQRPAIGLTTMVDFGTVHIGATGSEPLEILNRGGDTLRVTSIEATPSVFSYVNSGAVVIPPYSSVTVNLLYAPVSAATDTGRVAVSSNDPDKPVAYALLKGCGASPNGAPIISSILDLPNDQGKQVRIIWYRSKYDGLVDSFHVATYSVWRHVDEVPDTWDFIASVPAAGLSQYGYIAPTLKDSTKKEGVHWSVFKISAHLVNNGAVLFSAPDSGYSIDNIAPKEPSNVAGSIVDGKPYLSWSAAQDPDFEQFAVYRGTYSSFTPSEQNRVALTPSTSFSDAEATGTVFYRIVALDSAGNRSPLSNELAVALTDVEGSGTSEVPISLVLYQNYPNPFNPVTTIGFDIPPDHQGLVRLAVYDILGREVRVLLNEYKAAGRYSVPFDASSLASGVYIYRLTAGTATMLTRRMILAK